MSDSLSSPLELWNESRRMAVTARAVVAGDLSFEEAEDRHEHWPFVSAAEVNSLFMIRDGASRGETTDDVQRIIHKRVKPTLTFDTTGGPYDQGDTLASWNAARSAATTLLEWITTEEENRDAYTSVREAHRELLPGTQSEAETLARELPDGSYNEQHMALTRELYNRATGESAGVEGSVPRSIGEKLFAFFVDRELNDYQAIVSSFDDVVFPSRDVAMMEVMNTVGETREDRLGNVVSWVETWYDDETALRELEQKRPRRMGYRGK